MPPNSRVNDPSRLAIAFTFSSDRKFSNVHQSTLTRLGPNTATEHSFQTINIALVLLSFLHRHSDPGSFSNYSPGFLMGNAKKCGDTSRFIPNTDEFQSIEFAIPFTEYWMRRVYVSFVIHQSTCL